MRRQHIEANRLLDVAESGDREAYKRALLDLASRVDSDLYVLATNDANRQYRMYKHYHRLFAWRSDWTRQRKQESQGEY